MEAMVQIFVVSTTEDGRSMTTFHYCSVNYHIFFTTSKYAAKYVISFEVYDDFICQKTLKL
jgi:hypothetical protein